MSPGWVLRLLVLALVVAVAYGVARILAELDLSRVAEALSP